MPRHDKVIFQHNNARPHVAKVVKKTLKAPNWDVPLHPPHSPDIAPLIYHFFRSIAHGLAEQHPKIGSIFGSSHKMMNFLNAVFVRCLKDGQR